MGYIVNREKKARLAYFAIGLVAVIALGVTSPWLKSFGSAVYVSASLAYLVVVWLGLNWVTNRIRAVSDQ